MTDFATFAKDIIDELTKEGKKRTVEARKYSANRLLMFMGNKPTPMDEWDEIFVQGYETWLKAQGLSASTIAYYLSQLCAFYKQAAKRGIVQEQDIFRLVNKAPSQKLTTQQFPSIAELRYLRTLDLHMSQDFARNMFLFSLYTRGMNYVDIAYLKKSNIKDGMLTYISYTSDNIWMHQIMEMLRERLEPLMLEAIRQSKFTNNDATRLLVRSRETPDDPLKYTIEYVQAVLSLEKKLCVMLYDEGTRDHMLQEEKIFKDSSIAGFVADRAPQYPAIVKDLEGQELLRQACWFHARHYLVDAYLVDSRMEMLLILINALFYIERVFLQEDDQSPEHRQDFRKEWSEPIVDRIMEKLKKMRAAGDEYGQMVHRAVDYILDDEDAFRTFLSDGRIDIHNIAIERCFRHIAMGRRNWLQTGSHFSAQNLAFMFGLLESCKLNKVNFGEYIEDILTRILCGEEVDASFLPCDYVRHFEDGTDAEVTKTSQAVA